MGRKAALYNLGCKVNQYETDAMGELLEKAGYELVPADSVADVMIVNTCSVTNMADRKSRQILHRMRKKNPQGVIVACGCYTETWQEPDPSVDIVLGNNCKKDIVGVLSEWFAENPDIIRPDLHMVDVNHTKEYEKLEISRTTGHTRAFLKVQDGCNQFCSYCVIPYARGRIRSRKQEDVLQEVRKLVENGYREIVLTGIHLSSYGKDWDEPCLAELIGAVHQIPGVGRIRLGSLEPRIITEGFLEKMDRLPKLCHHFHLSLQSGCDRTLKSMNRHYSAEEYRESCNRIRKYWPDAAITTDVIVGFPGESEQDFEESRAFVDSINFYETHIFKYSRRRGTVADKMTGQIPEEIKTARSNVLLQINEEHKHAFLAGMMGKILEILVEERICVDGKAYMTGHTMEYVRCAVPILSDSVEEAAGKTVSCRAVGFLKEESSGEELLLCE